MAHAVPPGKGADVTRSGRRVVAMGRTDSDASAPSVAAGKPTSYSRVTLSRIMTAADVNLYGTVHGGVIMKFVDDAAGAAAARHSGGNAVTAAIDEIVFEEPVRVGDLVHAHAQINWTGRSSME